MTDHPTLAAGHCAVITGGASGIGLAAAKRFAAMGLKVVIADLSSDRLDAAAAEVAAASAAGEGGVTCGADGCEPPRRY